MRTTGFSYHKTVFIRAAAPRVVFRITLSWMHIGDPPSAEFPAFGSRGKQLISHQVFGLWTSLVARKIYYHFSCK